MTAAPASVPLLQAHGLTVHRRGRAILEEVGLELRPGELLCLLGANGTGKSTLLAALAGELRPLAGTVHMNGRSVGSLDAATQARMRAVLPQSAALEFDLRAGDVVAMGCYPWPELLPRSARALVLRTLRLTGVLHLEHARYGELSGGEQQRIQLARVLVQVLACRPAQPEGRYLLLDEPTSCLDPLHQQQLLQTVRSLGRSHGIGVLVVLHDVNLAARWADRIVLLERGHVLAQGEPAQVLTPAHLLAAYGVQAQVLTHPLHGERPLVVFG